MRRELFGFMYLNHRTITPKPRYLRASSFWTITPVHMKNYNPRVNTVTANILPKSTIHNTNWWQIYLRMTSRFLLCVPYKRFWRHYDVDFFPETRTNKVVSSVQDGVQINASGAIGRLIFAWRKSFLFLPRWLLYLKDLNLEFVLHALCKSCRWKIVLITLVA